MPPEKPKPYKLCQLAKVRGAWYFMVRGEYATRKAAVMGAHMRAAFGSAGLWRVRFADSEDWLTEVDNRPAGSERPGVGDEIREYIPGETK